MPGGVTTCTDPAKCGPGIAKGKTLSFNFPYASGLGWLASAMADLQSNAAQVGIKLNLQPEPINQVTRRAAANCVVAKIPCNWDMADSAAGARSRRTTCRPATMLFLTGAASNSGGYSNAENDAMIEKTLTSANLSYMYAWQDYLATQLP